jgi:hypothetical protein
MRKLYIIVAVILAAVLTAAAAASFFARDRAAVFVKSKGIEELNKLINTEAQVGRIKVDLLRGIIYFSDLKIKNPGGFSEVWFIDIPSGYIDINIESLLLKMIEIDKIFLDAPKFDVEIKEDSVSNTRMIFKRSAPRQKTKAENPARQKKETYFRIRNIEIKNAAYQFINYKVNPIGARLVFDQIGVDIINLTKPRRQGEMPTQVSCHGIMRFPNGAGPVTLEGRGGFLTELVDFDANLQAANISLPALMPFYVKTAPILAVTGSFNLTADGKCRSNNLYSKQQVSIMDLEVAANPNTSSDNRVFGLPVQTVIQFFINSRGNLSFGFDITGTLSDPQFHLAEAFKKVIAQSIGNAIIKGVSKLPNMVMEKVKETGNIEEAGKKALQDVFKQILSPRQEGRYDQQSQDSENLQPDR